MTDPKQKTEELAREAERGRSERTPWLALSGVPLAVVAAFHVIIAIAVTAELLGE